MAKKYEAIIKDTIEEDYLRIMNIHKYKVKKVYLKEDLIFHNKGYDYSGRLKNNIGQIYYWKIDCFSSIKEIT